MNGLSLASGKDSLMSLSRHVDHRQLLYSKCDEELIDDHGVDLIYAPRINQMCPISLTTRNMLSIEITRTFMPNAVRCLILNGNQLDLRRENLLPMLSDVLMIPPSLRQPGITWQFKFQKWSAVAFDEETGEEIRLGMFSTYEDAARAIVTGEPAFTYYGRSE